MEDLHEDGRRDIRGGVPVECAEACGHLVQNRAEGKDIASPVGRPPGTLLGRHVGRRAKPRAWRRQVGDRRQLGATGDSAGE